MKIKRAVGIDLGTTNSAIAMLDPQGSELLLYEDRFKRKTLPSMVGWNPVTEQEVTGWEAWNRRMMEPAPVASIKRKMGTQQTVNIGGTDYSPEEVSSKILARLSSEMHGFMARYNQEHEQEHPFQIEDVVITVPAYFDAPQIEATRQAGEQANLNVISLLQEPTAAAMYYAWKHGIGDGTFMVYDLGGGTFDVSVIRCLMGEYQVLSIDGDNYLGGDDFDRRLAEHLRKHLVEQGYALDLDIANNDDDRTRFTLLMRLAQEIKEALSTSDFQYVGRRDIFKDQDGNSVSIDMELSKVEFEELIEDLIGQTIQSCERALRKSAEAADVGLSEIEHILLVGGSTRVPLVQKMVAETFCGPNLSKAAQPLLDEPDTCVSLGAAIHAANVGGLCLIDDATLNDTTSEVRITNTLSTKSTEGRLVGRLDSEVASTIESVVLLNPTGDIAGIVRPESHEEGLAFALEDIELPDVGRYTFSLEFCDSEGDALASFEVSLMRLSAQEILRSTGSALSNPTVLAKDIYLEIVRDGRPERQILLKNGTSLPAEGKYRFYTADRSGAVILRLFQNRFPIRTIHLSVPEDTEVGTSVDLNLSVDETMTMVANGEILGQTFWAQIEPPPAREVKDWQEIEVLLDRVDEVLRELWGSEARIFREEVDPLVAGIRETARTDPDKLQVLVMRLEELLEDFHNRDAALTPGYGRYVALMDAIKRVVYRDDDKLPLGLTQEEWRQRLQQLEEQAESAYHDHDQFNWSRIFNQIQAIWESLAQDEYRFVRSDNEEYVRRMYMSLQERLQESITLLEDFNYSANPETRLLQEQEVIRLRQDLRQKVEQPIGNFDVERIDPRQGRYELDRMAEALNYFQRQFEKLPTIGLVRQ